MAKLRLIQAGVGGWGWSWASISKQAEDFDVVAYVDVSRDNLRKASAEYGIPSTKCYTNLDRAIKEVKADALLGVVPGQFHPEVAIKALEGGLHVLIEKPLADTVENAKRMIRTAEKQSRKLMVSQNYRFRKAPRTVRKILADGFVGECGYINVSFHRAPPFTGIYYLKLPEPIITEMIIHHFDLMRYILGMDPVNMYAKSWRPKWSWFDGNPTVEILIEMENDVRVNYFGSWVSRGWETTWDGDWRVECTEGEIHWNNNKVMIALQEPTRTFKTVFTRGMVEREGVLEAELLPMTLQDRWYSLHEFADSIIHDREPETNAKDNIKSLAMVFAAIDSSVKGKTVDMKSYI